MAGLASALALSDIGISSIVFDRRSEDELMEGAGINLQPRAVDDLNSLGVPTTSLLDAGNAITKQSYYLPDGRHVFTLEKNGKDGSPGQIAVHRGDLLRLLLDVAATKENVNVTMNTCVHHFDKKSDSDHLQVSVYGTGINGNSNEPHRQVAGSVLLGADGIFSNIRRQMILSRNGSNDDHIQYHGITHYRGVCNNFPT